MWWGSLISQGIQDTKEYLRFQQNKGVSPNQKMAQEHNVHMFNLANDEYKRRYQTAVKDATRAGLHPLFALGSGASYSPTASGIGAGGGSSAGGYQSRGVELGRVLNQRSVERRAQEVHDLTMKRGELEYQARASEIAREAQLGNQTRPPLWPEDQSPGQIGGDVEKAFPHGTKVGPELNRRPLVAKPRSSAPLRGELLADDGWRYRVLSPEAGMDELAQADLVYQWAMRKTRKARLALPREVQIWLKRWKRYRDNRGMKGTPRRPEGGGGGW